MPVADSTIGYLWLGILRSGSIFIIYVLWKVGRFGFGRIVMSVVILFQKVIQKILLSF